MATGRIGVTPTLGVRWSKAPTGGTTALSGLDDSSVSLVYSVGYEQVYRNGVLLSRGNDYTATDGTTITLIDATITGDIIEIFANELVPLTDAISKGQYNAKGALLSATAASTPGVLAVGANDTVLTADSAEATGLKWATPSSGGMTLISTTSLTGASVALTSIPQTYLHLQLIVLNYKSDTASQYLNLRFNQDSSANQHALSTGAFQGAYSFNQTSSQVSKADNPATSQGQIVIDIFNYTNATIRKKGMVYGIGESAGDQNANFCIAYKTTTAISSFDLFPDSGNFSTGTVLLYGVK